MERLWLSFCCILLIPLIGCSRSLTGSSTLTIHVPKTFGKVGALEALPANRKACYGVNVTGEGIGGKENRCTPRTGILVGYVEAGQTLEATVPKGSKRTVQLFVYLESEGQNTPCPQITNSMSYDSLSKTYLVSTKEDVDMRASEVVVNMTLNFPGETQNLTQQFNIPGSCVEKTTNNGHSFGMSAASTHGTSPGGLVMQSKTGVIHSEFSQTSTPSGIKLYYGH